MRYIDDSAAHGKIPADLVGFVKLKKFDWQREYRFVFEAVERLPDPFVLDVGPLHDVSMLMTLYQFKMGVSFDSTTRRKKPPARYAGARSPKGRSKIDLLWVYEFAFLLHAGRIAVP